MSDHEERCPYCGSNNVDLRWDNVSFSNDVNFEVLKLYNTYECEECGKIWSRQYKN
jgi:hypothetical protein